MSTSLRHIANMQRDMWTARRWSRARKQLLHQREGDKDEAVVAWIDHAVVLEARIAALEELLRDFKDQPHACIDRNGPVTLLECAICILKIRARELLEKP